MADIFSLSIKISGATVSWEGSSNLGLFSSACTFQNKKAARKQFIRWCERYKKVLV